MASKQPITSFFSTTFQKCFANNDLSVEQFSWTYIYVIRELFDLKITIMYVFEEWDHYYHTSRIFCFEGGDHIQNWVSTRKHLRI